MFIIIAGAGRLGILLTQKLLKDKHEVVIIDKSDDACNRLAEKFPNLLIIKGDATNPNVLRDAQIERADVLVATTSSDPDNIIICTIAKDVFSIRRTVSRVNDPTHMPLYRHMEVDVPVDATSIIARIVEEEASFSDVMNLLSIKKGRLSIVRVDIPDNSKVVGKMIKEIKLPQQSVLIGILRSGEIIIPRGDTKLLADDEVIAATFIDSQKELLEELIGKL